MKKLLSLPPNLVSHFHEIEQVNEKEWFCTSDPVGARLGSGGGTAWLLDSCHKNEAPQEPIEQWLSREKRVLLHAAGQSRRLPAYAPSGKILTPVPVFRWARGQKLSQNLLSLQLPLYEKIMEKAPDTLHTLVASGDVYIRSEQPLQDIPEADVVCYGLWVDPAQAVNHGVFVSDRRSPEELSFMLQKPSLEELGRLSGNCFFLMDIGIWLLSDKAVDILLKRSRNSESKSWKAYEMYSEFGRSLGKNPQLNDPECKELTVAILPLPGGKFYHFGTSRELISSTLAIQNLINDQRLIMHRKVKPHPAMFVQNAEVRYKLTMDNSDVWIENSCIGAGWQLHSKHIITGIPENQWTLDVPAGICLDVIPFGEKEFIVRPYGFEDLFSGDVSDDKTCFMGQPLSHWAALRGLNLKTHTDIQFMPLFPVCRSTEEIEILFRWMISEPELEEGKRLFDTAQKLSANDISDKANLPRLITQRRAFRKEDWSLLSSNYEHSVFYQLDLEDAAQSFAEEEIPLPSPLPDSTPLIMQMHDNMFRARVNQLSGKDYKNEQRMAFQTLQEGLVETLEQKKQLPVLNVHPDQIVWGRSPARIDLAGGWTDTPPFCLYSGGNVVNMAIELNGQPPLQVYVRPSKEYRIILRSIDLGAMESVSDWDELTDYTKVGSPFSIPKAALALAGFIPDFSAEKYPSLEEQLKCFGSGLEITLLAAIPAGSGLGTSSILAATVLGALSDFCGLAWDKNEIGNRTLMLEQLLTTGGGWQDQYGGILPGLKLLQTSEGFGQIPIVRWLPEHLFTQPSYQSCHLLYYTGITRTAKDILAEIVQGMFLNSGRHLRILEEMKLHALDMFRAIQSNDFCEYGRLIGKTWELNKSLDAGTNPQAIETLIGKIKDYCLGYKLPGAGGGGYLYMVAKDPEAAIQIRKILSAEKLNPSARFVDMNLSNRGMQVSRS